MPAELATSLDPSTDDRLLQAEAAVRAYCGWHIAPSRNETLTLDGTSRPVIFLPSLHVTDVTEVVSDGETVDSDDLSWSAAGIVELECGRTFTGKYRSVEVSLVHGYATPPPQVTAVVQAIAQRAVDNPGSLVRTQDGPFADTYSQTGFNQSLPIALLDAEREILDYYRLPPRP